MENTTDLEYLKFPIGPFKKQDTYSAPEMLEMIETLKSAPERYSVLLKNVSTSDQLNTYREGSWTVKQLVHHVADIQLLHFFRMKKAITEPDYKELTLIDMNKWAETPDSAEAPTEVSLFMLEAITNKYIYLIQSLNQAQLAIEYYHPVRKFLVNQGQAIAMSAWHVQHHLAHIRIALGINN